MAHRRPFTVLVAALALAGSGAAGAGGPGSVSVQLALTSEPSETVTYSLTCNPAAGTLPFAARVCDAIRLYPDTMFHPDRATVGHSGLRNGPSGPFLELKITANGVTSSFRGTPLGRWGHGFNVYYCAVRSDGACLTRMEKGLACGHDPVWSMQPVHPTLVRLCAAGQTTAAHRAIRIAEQAPAIAALQPQHLFPLAPGSRKCLIPRGDALTRLAGVCSVSVGGGSKAIVTFVERWPNQGGGTSRHTWRLALRGLHAVLLADTGPTRPQHWRAT